MFEIINKTTMKNDEINDLVDYILWVDIQDKHLLPNIDKIKRVIVYVGKTKNINFNFIDESGK